MCADSATFAPVSKSVAAPAVRRLILADFRSYQSLDLKISGHVVVLTGENGAGKTNLLEAISLFSPGRGLRRADFADCCRESGPGGFSISLELADALGSLQLGTGVDPPEEGAPRSRKCRIDRAPVSSATAFAERLRIVWLTPAMDSLFTGPAGDRRRFLDRLVLAVDAAHGARVNGLERALRNRNRLLEDGISNTYWLDATEREAAELAVAVAAARYETIDRLTGLIAASRDDASPFPWAQIALSGEVETLTAQYPAVAAEEHYRAILRQNRARDAAAGRTLIGPHVSDLLVRHGPKNTDAARSSTGEQKALLVGLVLAHARLVAAMSDIAPLILLDEIAAHFDPLRRAALYAALGDIGGQVWLTGADPAAFADLAGRAEMLQVAGGTVRPLG
ncbi:DNA replication/repair protein RecF [Methylovirgula sp. 4M-Z18]|uniref:DNA replication/repair protein RecF n=1 Tax=Methylovirgula sp. 4M-Z18 TaxID=2293567 RepID=UPI000E2F1666|nr:DNA replication/repair protein RecF [Methylovirgula sp. 4M-Z18]RFB79508.1 DNA replication/repair protein RecF [Methylovirgula sp. 4M-Z18]